MDVSLLNWFDVLVIVIILLSTLLACFKGFIKTIFSFFCWLLSIILTIYVSPYINATGVTFVLAITGSFIAFFIVFVLIAFAAVKYFNESRHGALDLSLGFLFGLVRGVAIICLAYSGLVALFIYIQSAPEDREYVSFENAQEYVPDFILDSQTYPFIRISNDSFLALIPDFLKEQFNERVVITFNSVYNAFNENLSSAEKKRIGSTLAGKDRETMEKVMQALPDGRVVEIAEEHAGSRSNLAGLDDLTKMRIFVDALRAYNVHKDKGDLKTLDGNKEINEDDLKSLHKTLNKDIKALEEENTGYKKSNIKQLDRLVGSVAE